MLRPKTSHAAFSSPESHLRLQNTVQSGVASDLLNLNVGVEFSSIGWVIKIDSLFNVVWQKKYG